jgi:hypothetical protein
MIWTESIRKLQLFMKKRNDKNDRIKTCNGIWCRKQGGSYWRIKEYYIRVGVNGGKRMIHLETERVIIRNYQDEDLNDIYEYFSNEDVAMPS